MKIDPLFWVFAGLAAQLVFNWYTIRRQDAAEREIQRLGRELLIQDKYRDSMAMRVYDLERRFWGGKEAARD